MASANADDGLVLHLTFDEPGAVARDASGNANHGKLVGDPVRIGTGVSGGALQFDGVDDYIECLPGSTAGLGAGDFTLELWLKTETRGHWQQLVSVGRKGTERGYVGLALRDNGLPQGCYSCTAADGTRHDKRRIGTVSLPPLFDWEPVTNGRWHHLAMVADRDENRGIPRLYRDGLEDTRGGFHSRGDASAIAVTNAEGLLIGARAPAPDKLYQGVLDEVRIYRRALTADEVRSHYEAYRTAQGPPKLAPTATLVRRTAGDTNWELKHFVIMPWGGPSLNPDPEGHDALPEVIKQAHFTTVLCGLDKLELCRQWGFKALLSGVTPDKAAELRDDEAVWGYMIKDEPWEPYEYVDLSWRMHELRLADPNHVGYINLGGGLGSTHPVYLDIVKPDLLSYDYYQWSWGREQHFSRLEEYRQAALEHKIPLLVWVHANAGPPEIREHEYYYRAPDNQERMRHSVFTSLAYGVKGIQWFHGKHVFAGDRLRPSGEDIAAINSELEKLGPELVKLESVEVYHTPPLPDDARPVPPGLWVQISGGECVMGILKDPDEPDADYLLVANRDHTRAGTALLRFARRGIRVARLDKQTGEWQAQTVRVSEKGPLVAISLAAGDGELLRVR